MKAYVLATGPTIKHFNPTGQYQTYGVNDVWSFVKTDYLVITDSPGLKGHARAKVILDSRPKKLYTWLYSQLSDPSVVNHPSYQRIQITNYNGKNLYGKEVPIWHCAAFQAAAIALRSGAKSVITYGVDWLNHPIQGTKAMLAKQKEGWAMLAAEAKAEGQTLYCGHSDSYLATFLPVYKGERCELCGEPKDDLPCFCEGFSK